MPTPKRVLFVVWTDPLISIGKHTFIADALRHAGADSIVESTQDWPQVSLEEMVRLQPEFLVFASGIPKRFRDRHGSTGGAARMANELDAVKRPQVRGDQRCGEPAGAAHCFGDGRSGAATSSRGVHGKNRAQSDK